MIRGTRVDKTTGAITRIRIASGRDSRPVRQPEPDVSTVGTRIRSAIETAAGFTMTCGHCLSYLRSLNKTVQYDHEFIAAKLLMELQLPIQFRQSLGGLDNERQWLRTIVNEVLA